MSHFQHILVPTDFGAASEEALELALTLSQRFDSRVTLIHAVLMPPYYYSAYAEGLAYPLDEMETRAKKALEEATTKAKERCPRVTSKLVLGQPWESILSAIQELGIDLVVMGTHGRQGLSRVVLGSVAEKVVRHSPVPVLTTGLHPDAKK